MRPLVYDAMSHAQYVLLCVISCHVPSLVSHLSLDCDGHLRVCLCMYICVCRETKELEVVQAKHLSLRTGYDTASHDTTSQQHHTTSHHTPLIDQHAMHAHTRNQCIHNIVSSFPLIHSRCFDWLVRQLCRTVLCLQYVFLCLVSWSCG